MALTGSLASRAHGSSSKLIGSYIPIPFVSFLVSHTVYVQSNHNSKMVPPPTLMFPSLHEDVSNAVSPHITWLTFNNTNTSVGTSKEYSTFVTGQFRCDNNTCEKDSWRSGKITILIRQYPNGSYNAEVFKQRCSECNWRGRLIMDEASYVERVSYRLLKWSGVQQEVQSEHAPRQTPPHDQANCEGCRRGVCRESER